MVPSVALEMSATGVLASNMIGSSSRRRGQESRRHKREPEEQKRVEGEKRVEGGREKERGKKQEIGSRLIFTCLVFVVIYYSRFQDAINIRCSKKIVQIKFSSFQFSWFLSTTNY